MKKILPVLLLSILTFVTEVQATHIMGGQLSYECLGNGNYLIKFSRYIDCNGAAASSWIPVSLATAPSANSVSPPRLQFAGTSCTPGSSGTFIAQGPWVVESFVDLTMI